MKILIVGGGPGGLYGAILLKKAYPRWEITLVERNPADATYGWGIVFSDRTLGSFREADYKTYKEITDGFVVWDTVEIRQNGAITRCGGNVFSGMSRKLLLDLLQRRCRELGVALRFQTDLTDFAGFDGFDFVIAADGANSLVRKHFAEGFRPTVQWGKAKYAWFGTTQVFDAFMFLFRETAHGLFQAHVYPHVGTESTMVVECDEATWRAAGLDRASEKEGLKICEKVFAADLRGRPMLANKSDWLSFPTIRNRSWRCGKVVLLGDAAHTAHFGIGSGTKLAMEDAIALANAFERHGEDFEAAAGEYELERRPVVEALQEAALESMEYFENTRRYVRFEPLPFAFHLLTRSSRISYDELRRRDPRFVDAVDRWFAAAHGGGAPPLLAPPPLFAPLTLRGKTLENRVVIASPPSDGACDGAPGEGEVALLLRAAQGGAGLVLTDVLAVAPEGRITPGSAGLYRPEHARGLRRLCEAVHARGRALVAAVLGHAGRRGATRPRAGGLDRPLPGGDWPLLAPSALPYGPQSRTPRAMDHPDMERTLDAFVRAAQLALQADADWLELHSAEGHLLGSFLSPLSNRRTDRYGGTLEARAAFPLEVFDAVRDAWPADRPLSVMLSATDWAKDGMAVEDAVAVAGMFREHGCDLVHVHAGPTLFESAPRSRVYFAMLFSDRIRNEAGIPTLVSGHEGSSDEVNSVLSAGRADLCVLHPRELEDVP